ncbi:MAG TPA: hypothetical protein VMU75_09860 [Acidimicrobiales bacterium]|nr:hypothetical protein [Acidimicrobiales bacterium]
MSAVLARPALWTGALRTAVGLVPTRWWSRAPFLPLPDREWLAFRMETAYGDPAAVPSAEDVVDFLAWAHEERRRAVGLRDGAGGAR